MGYHDGSSTKKMVAANMLNMAMRADDIFGAAKSQSLDKRLEIIGVFSMMCIDEQQAVRACK